MAEKTAREIEQELIQSVYNDNIDRIHDILNAIGSGEAKMLANARDTNNEPIVDICIRKNRFVAFEALVDAGADLEAFYGPNQALHIAAMYGSASIAMKIIDKGVHIRQNLRSSWPSDLAKRYNHTKLAEELQRREGKNIAKHEVMHLQRNNVGSMHYNMKRTAIAAKTREKSATKP
ncbi:MAG: hypothetical protein ACREBH_01765 [Candidatus Micrarchaeaceae archaeon]